MGYLPRIADALLVNLTFSSVYILIPLLLFRWGRPAWQEQLAGLGVAGMAAMAMAVQTVVGPLSSLLLPQPLHKLEFFLYLVTLAGACALIPGRGLRPIRTPVTPPWQLLAFTLMLLAAILLRLLSPLQESALGQSDAYSHLSFIARIIETSSTAGILYPPGYHWVAALPAFILPLDPYCIARYGGVFFGLMLIFAIKELAELDSDRTEGLLAAFLIACFPGSLLLMKTSVGVYANQLGLLFLPVLFHQYLRLRQSGSYHLLPLLLIGAGLLVSVPMMLFNVGLLLGGDFFLQIIKGRRHISPWLIAGGVATGAIAFVVGWFFYAAHKEFLLASIGVMTGAHIPATLAEGGHRLVTDFIQVKRWGLGSALVNTALASVALLILFCFINATHSHSRKIHFLCAWSLLTLLETAFGVFQFSSYQRAGWELNLSLTLLGGSFLYFLFVGTARYKRLRTVLTSLLSLTALISFHSYPSHVPVLSASENALVDLVRTLSWRTRQANGQPTPFVFERPTLIRFSQLPTPLPDVLVTRQFTDFTHGDPVAALLGLRPQLHYIPIGAESGLPKLSLGMSVAVLMDHCPTENQPAIEVSLHAMLQPRQLAGFASAQQENCLINKRLQEWIDALKASGDWQVQREQQESLQVTFLNRKKP